MPLLADQAPPASPPTPERVVHEVRSELHREDCPNVRGWQTDAGDTLPAPETAHRNTLPSVCVQPAARLGIRTESDEAWVPIEPCWPFAPVADMGAEQPHEEGVPAGEGAAPCLPVAVPQLNVGTDAVERPAPKPVQLDPQGQVEPDDHLRSADDRLTQLGVVIAVDHPTIRRGGHRLADPCSERIGRRLTPVRTVVERIKLDVGQGKPARELGSEG